MITVYVVIGLSVWYSYEQKIDVVNQKINGDNK